MNIQKTFFYKVLRFFYFYISAMEEKKLKVDFASQNTDRSDLNHLISNHYSPSSNGLVHILKKMDIKRTDKIIDIGCGKGKAMYMMSKFSFCQIDGYDISEELCEIARRNMSVLNLTHCKIFCANAEEFKEYDEYNFFYIYNSVPKSVFFSVFKNIKDSVLRNDRKIHIICLNPVYHDIIISDSSFSVALEYKTLISWFDLNCYTN